jgi:hypothetical protein
MCPEGFGLWDAPIKSPADAGDGRDLSVWCLTGAASVSLPVIQFVSEQLSGLRVILTTGDCDLEAALQLSVFSRRLPEEFC